MVSEGKLPGTTTWISRWGIEKKPRSQSNRPFEIVYNTWFTSVKNSTVQSTRSGLGGFSDRVRVLAFALNLLAVMLSTRESILTLLTGTPYQCFDFLSLWPGCIIFIQPFLHTLSWTVIEGRFYYQPYTYKEFISQTYMV
jgi:hypothetical protein